MLDRTSLRAALAAAIVVLLPAFAFAQQVGVKAGITSASLTPEEDESPDVSRRQGLVAGVWVHQPVRGRLGLQVEGLFAEKGVRFNATALGIDGSADLRLRYFEIPVLARGDFGAPAAASRIFAVAGAAPAFKLSARAKARFQGEEDTQDVSDEVESFDLGLVGGLGVAIGRATIEARYTHGLLKINTDDNGDEDRVKNRVLSVTLGIRLR